MIDDIPVGHIARLVLCDKDFHAPQRDPRYRLGPEVVRSVIRVPVAMIRDVFLQSAHVHRHCQVEGDTCLVWHNHVTWLDTDLPQRNIAHGDYFRIALPPSNAFNCDTSELVGLRQRGWTDQEILDILFNEDAESGHSPSLLGDDEVRALAHHHDDDRHDEHVALQVECHRASLSKQSLVHEEYVPDSCLETSDSGPRCDQYSFTEEFLQTVRMAETAPPEPAPRAPESEVWMTHPPGLRPFVTNGPHF